MAENRFAKYRTQQAPQIAPQGQNRFAKYRKAASQQTPVASPDEPQTVSGEGKGDRVQLSAADRNKAGFYGMADIMGMGLADEIAGGIEVGVRKLQGDDRSVSDIYTQFTDRARQDMRKTAAAAPDDYLGGQALGLGVGLVTGGSAIKGAQTLFPKVLQGAKTGAGYGAVAGFGAGEGLEDSAQKALIGGGVGATIGAGVPLAAKALSVPFKALRTMVPGSKAASRFADRKIAQYAEREGKTVAQVQAELTQLQKSNPDALVIDALGESGGRLGRAVVNRGGKGSRELSQSVYARQTGQNDRITQKISSNLGDPDFYHQTLDDSIEQLRVNAKPLYDKAYSAKINYEKHGPAISRAWSRVPQRLQASVVSAANDILVSEGKNAKAIGEVIGRGADGRVTPLPDVEQWDYVKRGLDAVIGAENTKGAAGGMSAIGRALNDAKTNLMKEIDAAVPEFAQARKVYSDDLTVKNALELGRKSLNTDAEMITKTIGGLDKAAQDTFRVGYARAMADVIDRMGSGQDAIARLWAAPSRRERLKAVFGNEKSFAQFAEFAKGEETMRKSYKALSGNSTTAQQLGDISDSGAEQVLDIGQQVLRGHYVGAAGSALRKTLSTMSGLTEKRADEIARVLASSKIPQGTVNRAGQYQLSAEQRAVVGRLVRDTASRSGAVAVTQQ